MSRLFQSKTAAPFIPRVGWSFKPSPDLPTDYKYEILEYPEGDFAFRIWSKDQTQGAWAEYWLHPHPEDVNYWELFPATKQDVKKHIDWENAFRHTLYWDKDKKCFTKGVRQLPLQAVMTIEMFNVLVRKITDGFSLSEDARII